MSCRHFTTFERGRIQELLSLGYSHRTIAQKLHRHHSSVDREIRRNTSVPAMMEKAHSPHITLAVSVPTSSNCHCSKSSAKRKAAKS